MGYKISAIVPVYNSASYIEKCLISLKTQNTKFFEIIVVDDGSTDNTIEVVKKIRNIKIISFAKNKGRSIARNIGAKAAKGKYIAFIESDSTYNKEWVNGVIETFNQGFDAVIDKRTVYEPKTFIGRMNAAIFDARFIDYTPKNA